MTFGREKRRLLGWLALFMPVPLPLNDVLEWSVLFAYAFLVIYYLQRVENGAESWLPNWALNMLGALYLPILLIDVRWGVIRDQVVKSLLHLILFLVVVKLFSIRKEKEKWHIFIAVFFIFVAAMATSSNLTIILYLCGAVGLGFFVLARFAHLHVLAALGQRSARRTAKPAVVTAPPFPPARSALAVALVAIIALSIPIFAAMPRMRQPFIMGQGAGNLGLSRTTGFSDQVDLSLTSEIRGNRAIALRLQAPSSTNASQLRLKAATYDFYRGRQWYRHPREQRTVIADPGGLFLMPSAVEDEVADFERVQVFLEPLNSNSLVLPVETGALRFAGQRRRLVLDAGGAVQLPGLPPRRTVQYTVHLDDSPRFEGVLRDDLDPPVDALDIEELSPRIVELAASVMGDGPDGERLDRLLSHLLGNYSYTLDFVGRDGRKPLEDFLFEHRSGHCEYFASAMVLMARSQGVPARLVTGFLGAEVNTLEDLYVVRQQNAHAWVEAWTPEQGWRVYDPTPPEGRPGAAERDLALLAQQVWDYLTFRWDRYVLTYGAEDQRGFLEEVRDRVAGLWQRLRAWRDADDPREVPPFQITEADPERVTIVSRGADAQPIWQSPAARYTGLAIFAAIVLAGVAYWRLWPDDPHRAYTRLRKGLAARDIEITPSLAPFDLQDRLLRDHPAAADDVRAVIAAYVAASFAERPLPKDQASALRPAVVRVLDVVRQDRKAERKAERRSASSPNAATART